MTMRSRASARNQSLNDRHNLPLSTAPAAPTVSEHTAIVFIVSIPKRRRRNLEQAAPKTKPTTNPAIKCSQRGPSSGSLLTRPPFLGGSIIGSTLLLRRADGSSFCDGPVIGYPSL